MKNIVDLTGKHILVCGASSGMGEASAKLLGELGAKTVLVARREDKLREVCDSLEGEGHRYYAADLGEIDKIEPLFQRIVEETGPFDGFANCAGIGPARPLKMMNYSFQLEVMNINYFSLIEELRCLTKRGAANKNLNVVSVSSSASLRGEKAQTAYAASKGAMDAAVRCLAREFGPKGIRINTIIPALVDTRLGDDYLERGGEEKLGRVMDQQVLGMGYPIDIANAVAFLLSDASRFITGSMLYLDGGYLA